MLDSRPMEASYFLDTRPTETGYLLDNRLYLLKLVICLTLGQLRAVIILDLLDTTSIEAGYLLVVPILGY